MLSTAGLTLAATKVSEDGIDLFSSSVEPGRASAFLILLSFLVTWLFIRTSARLIRMQVSWWPGNVETSSGLHIHHLVWGIVLMMVSGFIAFATELSSPWWEITSIAFGIGAGLTLDEYALWLHLEDVYWTEEGRSSIDAVVVAVLFAGLIVLVAQLANPVLGFIMFVCLGLGMGTVFFAAGVSTNVQWSTAIKIS